tara:strand:- start:632 stop:964 length:333 start_codon:yes stop_codon:yes gene_type:complete
MADNKDPPPWPMLAERLPALLQAQFAAYRRLVGQTFSEDEGPREVTAWENARKAALAHLQALIRVHDLVQAHLADPLTQNDPDLSLLLANVRRDLAEPLDSGHDTEGDNG